MSSTKRSWYCAKSSTADTPSLLRETTTAARQREPPGRQACPWQAADAPADSAVCGRVCMVAEQSGKTMRWELLYTTKIGCIVDTTSGRRPWSGRRNRVWPRDRDVPAPPAQVLRRPLPRRLPPGKKRDDRQDLHQPLLICGSP